MSGDAPHNSRETEPADDRDEQSLAREQIDQIRAAAADAIKPKNRPPDPRP